METQSITSGYSLSATRTAFLSTQIEMPGPLDVADFGGSRRECRCGQFLGRGAECPSVTPCARHLGGFSKRVAPVSGGSPGCHVGMRVATRTVRQERGVSCVGGVGYPHMLVAFKVVPLDEVTQRVGWALLEARGMGGGGRGGATM